MDLLADYPLDQASIENPSNGTGSWPYYDAATYPLMSRVGNNAAVSSTYDLTNGEFTKNTSYLTFDPTQVTNANTTILSKPVLSQAPVGTGATHVAPKLTFTWRTPNNPNADIPYVGVYPAYYESGGTVRAILVQLRYTFSVSSTTLSFYQVNGTYAGALSGTLLNNDNITGSFITSFGAGFTTPTAGDTVSLEAEKKLYTYGDPNVSGTATSATTTVLTDLTASWTTSQFNGLSLRITGGTGAGQTSTITATSATTITVSPAFSVSPDSTSTYRVEGATRVKIIARLYNETAGGTKIMEAEWSPAGTDTAPELKGAVACGFAASPLISFGGTTVFAELQRFSVYGKTPAFYSVDMADGGAYYSDVGLPLGKGPIKIPVRIYRSGNHSAGVTLSFGTLPTGITGTIVNAPGTGSRALIQLQAASNASTTTTGNRITINATDGTNSESFTLIARVYSNAATANRFFTPIFGSSSIDLALGEGAVNTTLTNRLGGTNAWTTKNLVNDDGEWGFSGSTTQQWGMAAENAHLHRLLTWSVRNNCQLITGVWPYANNFNQNWTDLDDIIDEALQYLTDAGFDVLILPAGARYTTTTTGTVASGATTTSVPLSGASFSSSNDAYNGQYLQIAFIIGSGTATGGSSTTLVDTNQTFIAGRFREGTITITSGTGSGQTRTVSNNTTTTITVSSAWTTQPDSTSVYQIAGGEWASRPILDYIGATKTAIIDTTTFPGFNSVPTSGLAAAITPGTAPTNMQVFNTEIAKRGDENAAEFIESITQGTRVFFFDNGYFRQSLDYGDSDRIHQDPYGNSLLGVVIVDGITWYILQKFASVSISPGSVSLDFSEQQTFTRTISGYTALHPSTTGFPSPTIGGQFYVVGAGSINSSTGLYTAPTSDATDTIGWRFDYNDDVFGTAVANVGSTPAQSYSSLIVII